MREFNFRIADQPPLLPFVDTSRLSLLSSRVPSATLISICWKCATKHWGFTLRLFLSGFVLNHIPMLDKNPVLNTHNICRNPIHRRSETAKSPVHDHEVSVSHDCSRFVLQRWWKAFDEIEQTFTARFDVRAVLDVLRRPESFCGRIIALVEKCVKRFRDEGFVFLFGCTLRHLDPYSLLSSRSGSANC